MAAFCLSFLLPACGGHKPSAPSPFAVKITLNPPVSASLQVGSILQFTASARNGAGSALNAAYSYTVTPLAQSQGGTATLDIAPNGVACAGTWNAPLYSVCTPGNVGVVQVTATALGATSPATLVFVHPPVDNVQISVVPLVNPPPPACPTQVELPVACTLPFNTQASNFCLSQNQTETVQAQAFSQGVDITSQVGPFTFTAASAGVATITPIITNNIYNVTTNQATVSPVIPGQTQLVASASGVSSQPFNFEACPVQCIDLQLTENGVPLNTTNFVVNKGTSETITATAVDVQGCIVPKPGLTWVSSQPAVVTPGSGCANNTSCTLTTAQAGSATITATCTPPSCNVGFPLNLPAFPAPYAPQPVYPVTAISGLVTGAASSTSVLATSEDCYSDILCQVGVYSVSTATNLPGVASQVPTPPNSLIFDPAGDRAYMGSEFGAAAINAANIGTANQTFTQLTAPGTGLGLVTGKVLAVSPTGNNAVFSDTVSTPNQVYIVNAGPSSNIALNINGATAAAFSPDSMKSYILGDGGNTLYIYSALQSLQPPISLTAPATSIVFNSTGAFALLSGGSNTSSLSAYNTCDNSPVSIPAPALTTPPLFLTLVPPSNIPQGNPAGNMFGSVLIPNLDPTGLDFFFGLDSTGIDIIATNSSFPALTSLCPQTVAVAHTPAPANVPFPPVHINLNRGTIHPINFFLSPDATHAYIVTTDSSQVLIYNFDTGSLSSAIGLINNAIPVSAGITVDGSLIYVAGSDGLLHQLNTSTLLDENQTSFSPLPNSPNSFCYTGANCTLNVIAVKP